MANNVRTTSEPSPAESTPKRQSGVTLRGVLIGLVATALIDLWIHYAELVLGGTRGHTALVNTSIPVGPFNALFALVGLNILLTRIAPSIRLRQGELVTIYVMSAVSTVLSSSGGVHFLLPTITAVHYFASPQNQWMELLDKIIPHWLVQTDPEALKAFYRGNAQVELSRWVRQIVVWGGFLTVFATATLCLSLILRKQWIEAEHLPFPTVALPIELTREDAPILKDRLFWTGTGLTFAVAIWNTLSFNYPAIPMLNVRGVDLSPSFVTPPWSAMAPFRLSFFPFAIGISYLLSTEVVFSVWFFFLLSKAQAVWGTAVGWSTGAAGAQSTYPWLPYQGAGAFLGLAIASIWVSRKHLAKVFRAAFTFGPSDDPDAREYKVAVAGLIASVLALVFFTRAAGASGPISLLFVVLVLVYLMAATRIRAETGNAWPVGPDVDAFRLLTTVAGTGAFRPSDLTALTYIRAATAGQDFRGVCMPQELDGLKMADSAGMKPGKLAGVMILAVAFGITVSIIIALFVFSRYGALAKLDAWRSLKGRASFDVLSTWIKMPTKPDVGGMFGISLGAAFTMLLSYLRMRYVWWPFHPVGYCMSNTSTALNLWTPCLIAWLIKVVLTRAGGMKLYRRAMPLFLGLIAGDFVGGGLTTLIGCFSNINVYPVNW